MPWNPNSVEPPADTDPFHAAGENDEPERVAFHTLVTAAPEGRPAVTVQPFNGAEPADTRTVATNPPVHWFTDTDAEQAPVGGGVVGGGVVGGGVAGVPVHVAVGNAVLPFLYTVIPNASPDPFGVAVSVPDVPETLAFHEFCNV